MSKSRVRLVLAGIGVGAVLSVGMVPTAQAAPAMCGSHANPDDMPNGYASSTPPKAAVGADPTYITACSGDSAAAVGGTAAGGTVTVPHVSTDAS